MLTTDIRAAMLLGVVEDVGMLYPANQESPVAQSLIVEACEDLEKLRHDLDSISYALHEKADRLFDPVPASGEPKQASVAEPPLVKRLLLAISDVRGRAGAVRSALARLDRLV